VHPNFPGLPWWGAVLVAVTGTAIGFAFDAGSSDRELTTVFSICYVLGCILAVLGVRQAGLFTAVIQPPLLLFASVPSAYFLFRGGQLGGVKDLAINSGYPLVERFPLMFFTSAAVLLIGMARWYLGMSSRRTTSKPLGSTAPPEKKATGDNLLSKAMSRLTGLAEEPTDEDAEANEPPRRRHTIERDRTAKAASAESTRAGRATSGESTREPGKPTKRATTASRSRHARPPETDLIEPATDRPRRPRSTREGEPPPADSRRRARSTSPREAREPREPRGTREPRKQQPQERRVPYERRERRRSLDDYEPLEPRSTNGATRTSSRSNGSHHPVSRVRYRADDEESRTEHRTRSRQPGHSRRYEADSWEYDV
jgi:hypothetical protein